MFRCFVKDKNEHSEVNVIRFHLMLDTSLQYIIVKKINMLDPYIKNVFKELVPYTF